MDYEAWSAPENAVILVLAGNGKTFFPALAETVELSTVIPASWFLTNISADRTLVPKLRTRDFAGCLCQRLVPGNHDRVLRDFGNGRECPDPDAAVSRFFDPFEFLEPVDADHLIDLEDMVPEAAEQVRTTGVKMRAFGRKLL
jgi:hypothetical protein